MFTADASSAPTLSAVTLCLVNAAGTLLSTHGSMRDDGLAGDPVAGDRKYSLQMDLPVDKVGVFTFAARGETIPPSTPIQSQSVLFWVVSQTEANAANDIDAFNVDTTNKLMISIAMPHIRDVGFTGRPN